MGLMVEIRGCYSVGKRAGMDKFHMRNIDDPELNIDILKISDNSSMLLKVEDAEQIGHCMLIGLVADEPAEEYHMKLEEEEEEEENEDKKQQKETWKKYLDFKKEVNNKFNSLDTIIQTRVRWYERTNRPYTDGMKTNEWQNMYCDRSKIFSNFCADPIVDVPTAANSRFLQFIIFLQTENEINYVIVAEQRIDDSKQAYFTVKLVGSLKKEISVNDAEIELGFSDSYGEKKDGELEFYLEKISNMVDYTNKKQQITYNDKQILQFEDWPEEVM